MCDEALVSLQAFLPFRNRLNLSQPVGLKLTAALAQHPNRDLSRDSSDRRCPQPGSVFRYFEPVFDHTVGMLNHWLWVSHICRVCTLEAVAALIHELENDDHTYDEMLRACQIKVGRLSLPCHCHFGQRSLCREAR